MIQLYTCQLVRIKADFFCEKNRIFFVQSAMPYMGGYYFDKRKDFLFQVGLIHFFLLTLALPTKTKEVMVDWRDSRRTSNGTTIACTTSS